ncbi:DUF3224 domain-containing protein [Leeia oryzae]|uniref:DUF3224 domain-containing protein n=1 Tax=Leeia oryzae TaxID=356662 RepID=UPI0003636274|nr:DUF3224 domain-containing protein [Leeia oryzae]
MATLHASGLFDVKLQPEPLSVAAVHTGIGRMSLDKVFHGELEAVSHGEMLAFKTHVQGSAGYVALEKVTGKLGGLTGSFVLQHSSTMDHGIPTQSITVVPDSGTDRLTGLTGAMVISITDGQHSYQFDYVLPTKG